MEPKRAYTKVTDEMYQKVVKQSQELKPDPLALEAVRYHSSDGRPRLELIFPDPTSPSLFVPIGRIEEFKNATPKDLKALYLSPGGDTIVSDKLDVHISVEGLILSIMDSGPLGHIFSKVWGAKGGRSTSTKKRVSSAENGKKGGRPRTREPLLPPKTGD